MKVPKTKVTLAKIRVPRATYRRWKEIGYIVGILCAMGLLLLALGAVQYALCKRDGTEFEKCFRHAVWEAKSLSPTKHAPRLK